VKITIKNLQKKIPIYPARIKKSILKAFNTEGPKKTGEITVSIVNDKEIRKLNLKYLSKNSATDVLAFDISNRYRPGSILADIIVSADTASKNARLYKTTPFSEILLYCVHGALHILGYDDHTPKEIKLMRKKETLYVYR
jgi:probable rRNA maturation factor